MSRYRPGHSYEHRCRRLDAEDYAICWSVDYYYHGSRLRHPRHFERVTNFEGARRFCRKWGLNAEGR